MITKRQLHKIQQAQKMMQDTHKILESIIVEVQKSANVVAPGTLMRLISIRDHLFDDLTGGVNGIVHDAIHAGVEGIDLVPTEILVLASEARRRILLVPGGYRFEKLYGEQHWERMTERDNLDGLKQASFTYFGENIYHLADQARVELARIADLPCG
jgi:hypothetical protein